jgi:nucleotide-binding universal stress UspA family protein
MSGLKINKILVPTDFSEAVGEAEKAAMVMAKTFGASVDLLHVITMTAIVTPPADVTALHAMLPELTKQVQAKLDLVAGRFRDAGIPCEEKSVEGRPHSEILRYAHETSADLIVMSTHGHGGIAHAVLGSVTERVLHRAGCPVLVVPVRA